MLTAMAATPRLMDVTARLTMREPRARPTTESEHVMELILASMEALAPLVAALAALPATLETTVRLPHPA